MYVLSRQQHSGWNRRSVAILPYVYLPGGKCKQDTTPVIRFCKSIWGARRQCSELGREGIRFTKNATTFSVYGSTGGIDDNYVVLPDYSAKKVILRDGASEKPRLHLEEITAVHSAVPLPYGLGEGRMQSKRIASNFSHRPSGLCLFCPCTCALPPSCEGGFDAAHLLAINLKRELHIGTCS